MSVRLFVLLFGRAVRRFIDDDGPRYGAALAFYATLSLAPLLLLTVAVVSLIAHEGITNSAVIDRLTLVIGSRGADLVADIMANSPDPDRSLLSMIGSIAMLLIGGSVLFVNMQRPLNVIWHVQPRGIVRSRLLALLMILVMGGLLLISMFLGAAAAWAAPFIERDTGVGGWVVIGLEMAVSASILTLLCAATYRILPDVDIAWRDVWLGAAVTTILFLIGRTVIGLYIGRAAVVSRFGAAGSLVAFLIWVYYSAQIYFLGAEFTHVWTQHRLSSIVPTGNAERPAGSPTIPSTD